MHGYQNMTRPGISRLLLSVVTAVVVVSLRKQVVSSIASCAAHSCVLHEWTE